MFSSVGWFEILVILVVGLLVIGPERLPGLINEARAVLLAIRKAVGEAREQLDGEFGDEIKQFSKPLAELNNVRQMGAKGFITKTLLDGDDSLLTSLDSTKKDVEDTVNTVRRANVRDTLRNRPTQSTAGAPQNSQAPQSSPPASPMPTEPTVPVAQQAAAGESLDTAHPVQDAATAMNSTNRAPSGASGNQWEDAT